MANDAFEQSRRFAERMRESAQRQAEQSRRTREMWEQDRRRRHDQDDRDRRTDAAWDSLKRYTRRNQASPNGGSLIGGIIVVAAVLFIIYVASHMGYHP
jgi:hypothetical protein